MDNNLFKTVFIEKMNRLAEVFPGVNNRARLPRYFHYVSGLPVDAIDEIIQDLLDSSKSLPLPTDFDKAAKNWRKNYYSLHGHYYSNSSEQTLNADFSKIDCAKCNDLGVLKIVHRVPSDFESLMNCSCATGSQSCVKIPEWDSALSGVFVASECPSDWFKPEINEEITDKELNSAILDCVKFWNEKKSKAELHWKNVGFK